jgi:hypothetical protein
MVDPCAMLLCCGFLLDAIVALYHTNRVVFTMSGIHWRKFIS